MIPFIKDEDTQGPSVHHPSANLIRVVADNAGPFTYTGTGTYILHMAETCVVIDPGPMIENHVDRLVSAIGQRRVEAILVTHTHKDHSPASNALKDRTGAPIWGCTKTETPSREASSAMDESLDETYAPDKILSDGDVLPFDAGTLRVFATPGHLSNHLCYFWQEEAALFAGDHVMGWATSVVIPPDGHMGSYMASLAKTLDLAPEIIWPTHGQPITNTTPFIKALIKHREAREDSILTQIQGGNGQVMNIVKALYTDIPQALYPAAAQSVFAHIIHLIEKQQILAPKGFSITDEFRSASQRQSAQNLQR
ncbi:MAG: MBL fold metallo-hydrolase [Sphingomonadales bacterium]